VLSEFNQNQLMTYDCKQHFSHTLQVDANGSGIILGGFDYSCKVGLIYEHGIMCRSWNVWRDAATNRHTAVRFMHFSFSIV